MRDVAFLALRVVLITAGVYCAIPMYIEGARLMRLEDDAFHGRAGRLLTVALCFTALAALGIVL